MAARTIKVQTLTCQRCGHQWVPRQAERTICPKCKSKLWDTAKKKSARKRVVARKRA